VPFLVVEFSAPEARCCYETDLNISSIYCFRDENHIVCVIWHRDELISQ
jgi:hypothetical protein